MMGLQEMAMQTYDDVIHPFACWVDGWDCRFKLNAPQNTLVEAEIKDSVIQYVKITVASKSIRKKVRLICKNAELTITNGSGKTVKAEISGDCISFDVIPGETYIIGGN